MATTSETDQGVLHTINPGIPDRVIVVPRDIVVVFQHSLDERSRINKLCSPGSLKIDS